MARDEWEPDDRPSAADRLRIDPPRDFDVEALVDDMLCLAEWMRDRRASACPRS